MPVVLAPGMEPAVSSDIVVSTSPIPVSLYTVSGQDIPSGALFHLLRRTAAGNFMEVTTAGFGHILLNANSRIIVLTTPGTYRVNRPDITDTGVAVGVETD